MKPQREVNNEVITGMIAEIEQMIQFYESKRKRYKEQVELFKQQRDTLEKMLEDMDSLVGAK